MTIFVAWWRPAIYAIHVIAGAICGSALGDMISNPFAIGVFGAGVGWIFAVSAIAIDQMVTDRLGKRQAGGQE